jgi:hypothetical protein
MRMRTLWLILTVTLLAGCADWDNRGSYPYVRPGEKGTPSDRTGGALPNPVPDPAYPPHEAAK